MPITIRQEHGGGGETAGTPHSAFTVPEGVTYQFTHFIVNNIGSTVATISVGVDVDNYGGTFAPADEEWIVRNIEVDPGDAFVGGGFNASGGDDVGFVTDGGTNVTFQVFGSVV